MGGCWVQAQQVPYGYTPPAYSQGYPQMAPSMPANGWPNANGGAGAYNYPVNYGNGQYPVMNNGYGMNYGYAIVERLTDGKIQFTEYDYATNAVLDQFRLTATGTAAP